MENKRTSCFPEYYFTKMDIEGSRASVEPSKVSIDTRKLIRENLFLMITLAGVIFGVVVGFGLRPLGFNGHTVMLISYPGELFMRLLKLMILPLIIASLISGSASLNFRLNGMIAVRTLIYFILTSFLNAILGVTIAILIHPGNLGQREAAIPAARTRVVNILDNLLDLGRNMFPENLFQATFQQAHTVYVSKKNYSAITTEHYLPIDEEIVRVVQYRSGTNTLGIAFFCLMFGTFLGTLEDKGHVVIDFFKVVFEVIMRMVSTAM